MEKQQILNGLKEMALSGQISKAEALAVFDASEKDDGQKYHFNLAEVLYYIGGGIVFLGIVVLIYQNWDNLSSPARILASFGSFVAALFIAAIFERYENLKKLSSAFFLISGLLGAVGVNILLKEMSVDINSNTVQFGVFLSLTAIYLAAYMYYKKTVLLVFGIIFSTVLFHFVVALVAGNNFASADVTKLWEYQFLAVGLAYLALGNYFKDQAAKILTGFLYAFGSLLFLGSAMALGGYSPDQNIFWELVYPLLVFGLIFASVYAHSKSLLIFGTLFLIGYIFKLTPEYFSDSLGWPLALVIAGLLVMVVGYFAVKINKEYLTTIKLK